MRTKRKAEPTSVAQGYAEKIPKEGHPIHTTILKGLANTPKQT